MQYILLSVAVVLALLLSLYSTPIAMRAAREYNIVDEPDGKLKRHKEPVPYLGGLSIFISFLLALSFVYETDSRILAILLSGSIIVMIGLIDDFRMISPNVKFAGQLIAAYILIDSGIYIKIGVFPEWLAVIITVIWIVGIMNAINIVDIMDGLAAGMCTIAGISFLLISIINSEPVITEMTAVLIGSTLGFLKFNYHPAKIYMGDSGSMFLGLVVGALSITGDYTYTNELGFLNPIIILSVPIFDTLYVMILRAFRGKSPFRGSDDHFAVRLRIKGVEIPVIVNMTYLVALVMGGLAIWNMFLTPFYSSILVAGIIVFYTAVGVLLLKIDTGAGD